MEAMLTVRIDKDIKDRAIAILKDRGMTVSSLMQTIINHIAATGDIPIIKSQNAKSESEIQRYLKVFEALELPEPMQSSDGEIREARLGEKYGFIA